MKLMSMACPACGGLIDQNITGRIVTCEYCGSRFVLDGDGATDFVQSMMDAQGGEEDETCSLSMPDFAAEACAEFLEENDNDSSFRKSAKILRGLGIGADEEVYLIHDDTMLHSGKNGFAITRSGLYCRDMGEDAVFFSWDDFARGKEPVEDDSYIACGKRHVCYFTDDDDIFPELLSLYERLYRHASKTLKP